MCSFSGQIRRYFCLLLLYALPDCGRRAHHYLYYLVMAGAVEAVGGSAGADRPSKKQKRDETEAAMLMASLGGPMEDEATARKKLQDAGFDPDSPQLLQKPKLVQVDGYVDLEYEIPMTYFCRIGDLKMCRYLLSKGALATQTWDDDDDDDSDDDDDANYIMSPMSSAASGGHVSICKWLCEHGGRGDIRKVNRNWFSPMHYAVDYKSTPFAYSESNQRQRETYRWFIMNEALCPNDNGIVDVGLIRDAFWSKEARDEGPHVLEWAEDAVRTYDGFMTFLMGTHRREVPPFSNDGFEKLLKGKMRASDSVSAIMKHLPEDQQLLIWNKEQELDCVLNYLSGHPGIRQTIADMVGVVRGRELRIMRNLEVMMRSFLEAEPVILEE